MPWDGGWEGWDLEFESVEFCILNLDLPYDVKSPVPSVCHAVQLCWLAKDIQLAGASKMSAHLPVLLPAASFSYPPNLKVAHNTPYIFRS